VLIYPGGKRPQGRQRQSSAQVDLRQNIYGLAEGSWSSWAWTLSRSIGILSSEGEALLEFLRLGSAVSTGSLQRGPLPVTVPEATFRSAPALSGFGRGIGGCPPPREKVFFGEALPNSIDDKDE
jgi:hypothetical protein